MHEDFLVLERRLLDMKSSISKIISRSWIIITILMLSIVVGSVAAQDGLVLPSDIVFIEVKDGVDSYFNTNLTGVPEGYSVTDGIYNGWCVDVRTEMSRSPAVHGVKLYSSLAAPGELAGEPWDMINYILNHKQGVAIDVQQAIWYFMHMDGNYTPTRELAWAMINDALANGSGYVPSRGEILAVICYPVILFPGQKDTQVSIIEIANPVVPEFVSFALPAALMVSTLLVTFVALRNRRSRIA